jgi:predicted nucleic acid-binding protein
MPKQQFSVLVDTSFLINLYNSKAHRHKEAKAYFKEFLDRGVTMYLSTIVVSEYQQKQPVTQMVNSKNYITLPYNYLDALKTAEMSYNLGNTDRVDGEDKASCKDDVKLIGQAAEADITWIITDDEKTLYKYTKQLHDAGIITVKPIALSAGVEKSIYNNGQAALL